MNAEYGTANYLVAFDPNDPDGRDLWTRVFYCRRCGAAVYDKTAHNKFHYLFGKD